MAALVTAAAVAILESRSPGKPNGHPSPWSRKKSASEHQLIADTGNHTVSTKPSSTSQSAAAASSSQAANSNNGGPSSPLLFFVALGFGVVFTNLW